LGYTDKEKQAEYSRRHYLKNKEKYRSSEKKVEQDRQERFRQYKATLSCEKCGGAHPAFIQFHHRDPSAKKANIARVAAAWPWERLMKEIEKCDILCANCHLILHYKY
jgi:hypothetical protein